MAILNGDQTAISIKKFIASCKTFSIAVAWATENSVWDQVKIHIRKAKHIVIGIDFFQTSPKVIEWLRRNAPNITYIADRRKGVFHPKIYLFEMKDDKLKLVIGSANLTYNAFTINDECCIRLDLKQTPNEVHQIFETIDKWIGQSTQVGNFDVDKYKTNHHKNGREIKKLAGYLHSDLLEYSFTDYFNNCASEVDYFPPSITLNDRLDLLDLAQSQNIKHNDFCYIAGVHPIRVIANPPKWGYFGSMSLDKAFMQSVKDNKYWTNIFNLYNGIPSVGNSINYTSFIAFVDNLDTIINNSPHHINNINHHFSAATRLLAMKRPDLFFCLNGGNKVAMAKDFAFVCNRGVVPSSNSANSINKPVVYWDVLTTIIKQSTWCQSPINGKWGNDMKRCWRGRIAMLDALYY